LFYERSKLTQVIFVAVAGMWGKDLSSAGVVLHYTVRDDCPAGVLYTVVGRCEGTNKVKTVNVFPCIINKTWCTHYLVHTLLGVHITLGVTEMHNKHTAVRLPK
jgi:hypothetical protein